MSLQLTEIAVQAIITQLRNNIASELTTLIAARPDNDINLVKPQSYFFYETKETYKRPAVFVIAESLDTELQEGGNFISGKHSINVTVIVEERTERLATEAAWRYQAALFKVLHLNQLAGPSSQSKIIPKVTSAAFSPVYTEDSRTGDAASVFCKEVALNLNVDHWEPL